MNGAEREELARFQPYPVEPELSQTRYRQHKQLLMATIRRDAGRAERGRPAWRLPRPALLASALAAAVTAVIAVPLVLGGGQPAYAVTKKNDGTLFVAISEAKDPKGLQAKLRSMGLNAVVDYVPPGKKCSPQPRSRNLLPLSQALLADPAATRKPDEFTIDPKVVKSNQTAVLEFSISESPGRVINSIWARVADGPVADCTLVDD
ncbi:hypothetical protein [Sphaerisporangium fuscum]|uniref:hypothetical protein n=1 Tax=Sphaerisporangium fuscum TaxID=2835868 RepID=UPI001BDC9579|nr:hypothetical protein [Sphaerisporangium fuscum]